MLSRFFFALIVLLPISASTQALERQLEMLVDSVYQANPEGLGILIHVEAPNMGVSWSHAVGYSASSKTKPLEVQQPVLTASNTKPYVSATILKLVENQILELEDVVSKHLSPRTREQLKSTGYQVDIISIKDLLSHTSGIQDYVDELYFDMVFKNPMKQWSKEEQIQRAMDKGKPVASPGEEFAYGDINYLLLAEIIENKTGKPFHTAIRELLNYESLDLNHTWFVDLESTPLDLPPFAHQYAYDFEWDSYNFNPSWDLYGGGGIASTVQDAALFFQYLFNQKIINDKDVLDQMTNYVLDPEDSRYCLGMYHFDFGYSAYYHGGWWGTDVMYSPDTNATVAVFTLVRDHRQKINPFLGKTILEMLKG